MQSKKGTMTTMTTTMMVAGGDELERRRPWSCRGAPQWAAQRSHEPPRLDDSGGSGSGSSSIRLKGQCSWRRQPRSVAGAALVLVVIARSPRSGAMMGRGRGVTNLPAWMTGWEGTLLVLRRHETAATTMATAARYEQRSRAAAAEAAAVIRTVAAVGTRSARHGGGGRGGRCGGRGGRRRATHAKLVGLVRARGPRPDFAQAPPLPTGFAAALDEDHGGGGGGGTTATALEAEV